MKSLILSSAFLVFVFVHSATSSAARLNQKQMARIPCNGLLVISDEDREGLSSIKYTWKFHKILVDKISSKRQKFTVSGYGDLLIDNFGNKDHGTYSCEVDLVIGDGIRIVDNVDKHVDESYIISEKECSPHSCINAKNCYYSSSPKACPGKGDICCENSEYSIFSSNQ